MSYSGATALGAAIVLSEDKDATVAVNYGWTGKRYADPTGDDEYEAIVYSNVEAPEMGKKFGSGTAIPNDNYEYQLTNGALAFTLLTAGAANVVLAGVTRTAGTEPFNLPDPNPNNEQVITVSGSFHGVSGTYNCDTGASRTDACTASVATKGYTLAGARTFTPSNPEARVRGAEDTVYASYGWWLLKEANDGDFRASAFHDAKGAVTVLVAADLLALQGTATYVGGADGMARNWSVELKEATIDGSTNIGALGRAEERDTVWAIDDASAAASGEWSGSLRNQGDDDVP